MKITRSTYIFDEEFDLVEIIDLIIKEESENFEFLSEKLWFEFSQKEINEYIYISFIVL